MNKSKFKTVRFKPFDSEMYYSSQEMWVNSFVLCGDSQCVLKVTDSCIEAYPELFEVEKAEREFEEGAYYKVRFQGRLNYEVALCRINETNGLFTFTIPDSEPQYKEAFQEIGEKIELENEL